MKKLILIILVVLLAAGAWLYFKRDGGGAPEYLTVPVTRGEITQIVTATGTLNPVVNVQVGSQISGNIQKLFADFNSPVTAGMVVAQLDPSVYQAIVHQAEGDLASAMAGMELARLTANRKKELVAQHAAAQADLDSAMAALHQAEAAVQVKQANLEKTKVDLDHCTIYSPIDGTVISRAVDVGQTVAAALNAPVIFTVANDLAKMQIDSNVAEADVGSVEVAQSVDFSVDAFPYRTFHGTVKQVRNAATTTQNVVSYDVVISVMNEDLKLKPGMTANVSIIVAQRDDAVKLPNAGLRFRPPEKQAPSRSPGQRPVGSGSSSKPTGARAAKLERTVYTLPPGATEPQPATVKLGITDGIHTEVLEGLQDGDVVVTGMNSSNSDGPAQRSSNPLSGGTRFR